jgi:hypothetical protein
MTCPQLSSPVDDAAFLRETRESIRMSPKYNSSQTFCKIGAAAAICKVSQTIQPLILGRLSCRKAAFLPHKTNRVSTKGFNFACGSYKMSDDSAAPWS